MEHRLWGFTQEGKETPPEESASATVKNAFRLQTDRAHSLITLNVEKDLQVHISSVTDLLAAWTTLQKQFEFVSVTQIVCLNRKFYAASMKEGADLQEYLTYITSLAEQLREMKEEISLKNFVTVVLGSLPQSYNNFLVSLNARNTDDLDWESVKGLLIEEFFKQAEKSEKQEADNVLYVKKESFNRGRYQAYGGIGHGCVSRFWKKDTPPHHDDHGNLKGVTCFKCKQDGHMVKNCPLNKPNSGTMMKCSHQWPRL